MISFPRILRPSLSTRNPAIACAAALLALTACERPFVEGERPGIEIVEPDFSNILLDPSITISVQIDADESVDSVSLNGRPLEFDGVEGLWRQQIDLEMGLNRLIFSVTDFEGDVTWDTSYAFHILPQITQHGPVLPDPRGGHTATLLPDGSVVAIGGAFAIDSPVRNDAAVLLRGGARFRSLEGGLNEGRAGHTATLLPDGRILIAGGARSYSVESISDLVETVEIYDAETDQFSSIPVSGPPIRRAFHTALLRASNGEWIVDLFGGTGDIQYEPSPLLGIRRDIRSFLFRNDSLIALSPAPGPGLEFALSGHSLTPLEEAAPEEGRVLLLLGTVFGPGTKENVASVFDYSAPGGLELRPTGEMIVPRTAHAAALLGPGVVAVFGGHQGSQASVLPDIEFYVAEAERFFYYPLNTVVQSRFGHTATKLSTFRIMVSGGFSPDGHGLTQSEVFAVPSL